jgi:septal ring factor EnvC (AmiA/AmiB activator)
MDKVARDQLESELAELRREIRELQDEQAQLNKHAPGPEGNRHAFITTQLQILRDTEAELNKPLLDAMEDDIRDAPP